MSALPPKADIADAMGNVRFVPVADFCTAATRRSARASNSLEMRLAPQLLCPLEVVVLQRERADALAGCSKDRVAERRRHERWRRLANAAPESAARHDNALDSRRLGKTHHRIVVEVRLLDAPVLNGDLAKLRGGEAPHDAAFYLLGNGERIDGIARIERKDDTTHPHVPGVAERHLEDHGLVAPIR